MVEQYSRHPMGAQWLSHHRIQHRRGEHRADHDPAGQVGDLGAPFFGLGGFNFRGSRLAARCPLARNRKAASGCSGSGDPLAWPLGVTTSVP